MAEDKYKYHSIKANYKRITRGRNIEFCMTEEEFIKWYNENPMICHYCGITKELLNTPFLIGRKDNNIGYRVDNIVWSCKVCNTIKGNIFSEHEMQEIGQKYVRPKYITNINKGTKYDDKKLRMDLIPLTPLYELAKVYTIGADKYGDRNYLKGMKWSRVYAALLRHITKWWGREQYDQVDGQSHLSSVAWAAFTLMEYEQVCPELDDRPERG